MNFKNSLRSVLALMILISAFGCEPLEENDTKKDKVMIDNSASAYYSEPHRPQFHFSPEANWMNDPNGMVYFEGEYHLFYQYYPDSTVWGPMHWGHAVSTDLVHWEHLPIALYPDSLGFIFSGSAVIDWDNSSGLGKGDQPPMIAIFTHHDPKGEKAGTNSFQYQSLAFSHDKGRTWTKYEGNPVIPNLDNIRDFRDPKVIWDESSKHWIMVFAAYDHVQFWRSKNLIDWTHLQDWGKSYGGHGGVWECPDFFSMKVKDSDEVKWVLLQSLNPGSPNGGSGTQYFIGDFDGKTFKLDPQFEVEVLDGNGQWLDYGRDNYAGVTWSDIPKEDGRRLFMGWMSNWNYAQIVPTEEWRSAMTLPRELILKKVENQYRLFSKPVEELKLLRGQANVMSAQTLVETHDLTYISQINPKQLEIMIEVELPKKDSRFGIELSNEKGEKFQLGFDTKQNQFFSDRTKAGDHSFSDEFSKIIHIAPRLSKRNTVVFHCFIDQSSIELFADTGYPVMTDIFFPSKPFDNIKIFVEGAPVKLLQGASFPLSRIWKKPNPVDHGSQ